MSSISSSRERHTPRKEQRSLSKLLEDFWTSFTRRDSTIQHPEFGTVSSTSDRPRSSHRKQAQTATIIPPCELIVDDSENIPGTTEEPIISLDLLERDSNGIAEAKTKQLFERHHLTYQTRRPAGKPPVKMRRVDKPARIRVRWTCHDCNTAFGADECCPSCQHRKCNDCHRDPPRRHKPFVQTHDLVAAERVESWHDCSANMEAEFSEEQEDIDWSCKIQIGRPRPLDQQETNTLQGTSHGERSTSTPLVERVYRKPRQRVRYNCELCNLQFASSYECSGCGHERCVNCPRFPPRKRKVTHDAAAWQALQAKIDDTFQAPPVYADVVLLPRL